MAEIATATSTKKAKDPEKIFIEKCKLYFSSLTARSAQFAYFNIVPNGVILCNSTSPPPNKVHGDRIMQYGIGELTYHFVEFKDIEFFQEIKRFLQIPEKTVFCVLILNMISILNRTARKELAVFDNEYGERILQTKGRKTYDKRNVIGFPIYNFHIIGMLAQWREQVKEIGSVSHKERYPSFEMPVNPDIEITGRVFLTPVCTDLFVDTNQQPVFKNVKKELKILGLDGLTCASIKEFYKKVLSEEHRFTFYFWAVDAAYVLSMTFFENASIIVRSIRPNVLSIPISNNIVMEMNDLLALSEDSHE